jgi:predicted ATPase
VGREGELGELQRALELARSGERQVVFVAGEPGIGKTLLLSNFLAQAAARAQTFVARSRCLEQQGASEAYLPILEALARLCRGVNAAPLLEALDRTAPSWLEQMPSVGGSSMAHGLRAHVEPAPLRMLRELAEALDHFTQRDTLILCLEDIQYADESTLDLVHYLGQRTDASRLLIVCAYAPLDGPTSSRQRRRNVERCLNGRSGRQVVWLPLLGEAAVVDYLARRFEGHEFPDELAPLVLVRTTGKPVFMVKLLDSWVERGWITPRRGRWALACSLDSLARDLPDAIVEAVEAEVDRLEPLQRRILEVASIARLEFSAATLAGALGLTVASVEEECLQLGRSRRFLRVARRLDTFAGSSAHCFEFIHAFQRQVVAQSLGMARRCQLLQALAAASLASVGAEITVDVRVPAAPPCNDSLDLLVPREPRARS